jgi:hypothetical protein
MNIDQIQLIHEALAADQWIDAANLACMADEVDMKIDDMKEADFLIRKLLQNLLDGDNYLEAAVLLWDRHQFDPRPSVTQQIFKAIRDNNRLLIMSGSSLSKTFSAGIYFFLDWRRDPYYTNIKLVSANEDNLRTNLYSHITALHRSAVIPMKEELIIRDNDLHIGIKDWIAEMGISGIAVKQGLISSGGLRGHKPKPYRKAAHPQFGFSSRVRVLIDESQDASAAAFGDLQTIEASITGLDLVKIIASFNPVSMDRRVVEMAEPQEGWTPDQLESLYNYEAKSGYQVLRLDGAQFENVVQRKVIYPNMLTYTAYINTLKVGDNSAAYYVLRGFPPMKDSANTVIPPEWLQTQRGEAIYTDKVENIVSCDLAFQGADKAAMALGRWGLAAGWRKENGTIIMFEDRLDPGKRRPRHVLTVDQLFILPKSGDTVTMVQEIMGRCKNLLVPPENCCMDSTGAGLGVWSHAVTYWGDVLGINWYNPSTDKRILSGDLGTAEDSYEGLPTEMWYTFKRWLDPVVNSILFNPTVPTVPLYRQLMTRRVKVVNNKRQRIESKDEYKARNGGHSPDDADALIMLSYLIRMRFKDLPGIMEINTQTQKEEEDPFAQSRPLEREDRIESDAEHVGEHLAIEQPMRED